MYRVVLPTATILRDPSSCANFFDRMTDAAPAAKMIPGGPVTTALFQRANSSNLIRGNSVEA